MAYSFVGTSSQYIRANASPLGTGQLGNHSIALWLRGPAATGTPTVFSIGRSTETSAVNNPCILIQNLNGTVFYLLRANSSSSGLGWNAVYGGQPGGLAGGTAFDNTLHHVCCTLSGTVSTNYVDGVARATYDPGGTVPVTTGLDRFGIGAFVRGNVVTFYTGMVAEVGIWNAALDAASVASLARGASPSLVNPQSLVFYAPLVRGLADHRNSLAMTNTNNATVTDHPRVYA